MDTTPVTPPQAPRSYHVLIAGLIVALVIVVGAFALLHTAAPNSIPVSVANRTPWQAMMDYFTQDVCVDKNGNVMMGVSPIDGNPGCVSHRDLLPGERLPYHVENPKDNGDTERIDTIPIDTGTSVGIIGVTVKDNFGKPGETANVLDTGDGINNIYIQSSTTISSYSTIDSNGPTYHVGPNCSDTRGGIPNDLSALYDSVVRITTDAIATTSGSIVQHYAKVYNPGPCINPSDYIDKKLTWKIASYSYDREDGTKTPPLLTLVSQDVPNGNHNEIYYQTRELGRTRFEAWQEISKMTPDEAKSFTVPAAKLKAAGGDCTQGFNPPPAGGTWVMFACGDWTTITPPSDMKNGDYPDQFISALKGGNMSSVLFGLPPASNPKITSVTPSSFSYGKDTTITVTGTFPSHYPNGQVLLMIDGGLGTNYVTPTNTGTQVTFSVSWDQTRKGHALAGGTHVVHIYDGESISNPLIFTVVGGGKKDKSGTAGNTGGLDGLD